MVYEPLKVDQLVNKDLNNQPFNYFSIQLIDYLTKPQED